MALLNLHIQDGINTHISDGAHSSSGSVPLGLKIGKERGDWEGKDCQYSLEVSRDPCCHVDN